MLWDLSSPTRDRTPVPCSRNLEPQPLYCQGSPPSVYLKEAHVCTCSLQGMVQRGVYLYALAHAFDKWALSDLMDSGRSPPRVTLRDRPQARNWPPSPPNRTCRRGSRRHLCGMWLLIQMSFLTSQGIHYVDSRMTRCGTGRTLKGNFTAAVMFQASLWREALPHE